MSSAKEIKRAKDQLIVEEFKRRLQPDVNIHESKQKLGDELNRVAGLHGRSTNQKQKEFLIGCIKRLGYYNDTTEQVDEWKESTQFVGEDYAGSNSDTWKVFNESKTGTKEKVKQKPKKVINYDSDYSGSESDVIDYSSDYSDSDSDSESDSYSGPGVKRIAETFIPEPEIRESYSRKGETTLSNPYSFQGTFINSDNSRTYNRLAELEKYAITDKEMRNKKISDNISEILNNLNVDPDLYSSIKNSVLINYDNIVKYYTVGDNPNPFHLKSNTQSLKRGYIALMVINALRQHGQPVTDQEVVLAMALVPKFKYTTIADLPEAMNNVRLIFRGFNELNFKPPALPSKRLCGLYDIVEQSSPASLQTITNIIKKMISLRLFSNPPTDLEYAAVLYHVFYNLSNPRQKLTINGVQQNVTPELLAKYCQQSEQGSISRHNIMNKIKLILPNT